MAERLLTLENYQGQAGNVVPMIVDRVVVDIRTPAVVGISTVQAIPTTLKDLFAFIQTTKN